MARHQHGGDAEAADGEHWAPKVRQAIQTDFRKGTQL
jgi:hypothetical protein